jgi:LysM repeat protein
MSDADVRPATAPAGPTIAVICPYLVAADGGWRSIGARREHRCSAVNPPTILAVEKQRRLCLVDEHRGCSTYLAAAGPADDHPNGGGLSTRVRARATTRPLTRTMPVLLDQRRIGLTIPANLTGRGVGQGGLVALMVVAFGALAAGRLTSGGIDPLPAGDANPTASPAATASVATEEPSLAPATVPPTSGPDRTLVPSAVEPTPAPSGEASPPPTVAPPASAVPSTYTIARGDTLSGIAAVYGTTWQILAELNGIDDPGRLRVGQVIQLP